MSFSQWISDNQGLVNGVTDQMGQPAAPVQQAAVPAVSQGMAGPVQQDAARTHVAQPTGGGAKRILGYVMSIYSGGATGAASKVGG